MNCTFAVKFFFLVCFCLNSLQALLQANLRMLTILLYLISEKKHTYVNTCTCTSNITRKAILKAGIVHYIYAKIQERKCLTLALRIYLVVESILLLGESRQSCTEKLVEPAELKFWDDMNISILFGYITVYTWLKDIYCSFPVH